MVAERKLDASFLFRVHEPDTKRVKMFSFVLFLLFFLFLLENLKIFFSCSFFFVCFFFFFVFSSSSFFLFRHQKAQTLNSEDVTICLHLCRVCMLCNPSLNLLRVHFYVCQKYNLLIPLPFEFDVIGGKQKNR